MRPHRLLVVEDDVDVRRALVRLLQREGCDVKDAADGEEAVRRLEAGEAFDLVITDLDMPLAGGKEVLQAASKKRIPVVVLTGNNSVTTAVELMRAGAANYLMKPFSPPMIRAILDEAFGRVPKAADGAPIIGEGDSIRRVLDVIGTVAETEANVLITGESGTGKTLVARAIHDASRRAKGAFVVVNCGAIPEALLESELFGHAKGAFTGATHTRAGRFQLADGGTLFLDEIGDMPLPFQVKLLRVLQDKQFEVLGESSSRSVDVRVIAATHRDLKQAIAGGRFREDLYYRLNVVELPMPALRDRKGDLPLLIEHFIAAANARHGRHVAGASPEAMAALTACPWPGNVRQLANVIERMVIFRKTGTLELADLPAEVRSGGGSEAAVPGELPPDGVNLKALLESVEDSLIAQALQRTGGNRKAAADLLGLNRTTLVEKLKKRS